MSRPWKTQNTIHSYFRFYIKSVNIFDVFQGGNLPTDKKSIAINVSIQAEDKTLSDHDLNQISNKIIKEVENKTGGNIRS